MATVKKIKKAQSGTKVTPDSTEYFRRKALDKSKDLMFTDRPGAIKDYKNDIEQSLKDMKRQRLKGQPGYDKDGFPEKKKNGGKLLKRADGSKSPRGLWDNIRAAKGSGKKPTPQMLKQEKKIKLQSKKK